MITLPKPGHIASYIVEVEVVEPLHIGLGRAEEALEVIKAPLVVEFQATMTLSAYRQKYNMPVIPASSFKGVLRRAVEYVSKALLSHDKDAVSRIGCSHHQPTPLEQEKRRKKKLQEVEPVHATPEEPRELGHRLSMLILNREYKLGEVKALYPREVEEVFKAYAETVENKIVGNLDLLEIYRAKPDKLWEELASLLCPICLLFGSPHRAATIKTTDLYPLDSLTQQERETLLATRYHVAIDRKTGIRWEKALYKTQYVQPGTIYTGKLYIIIPELPPHLQQNTTITALYNKTIEKAQHILQQTLEYLKHQDQLLVKLGGHKTRGYGLARIEIKTTPR